ncbi:MAG TPA: tetratricopeptide repeat protein [Pyrinomonadaceae bacterium]|nr:tetratricopeptide repeat protein [Pyrinomonadaceae bacterium]
MTRLVQRSIFVIALVLFWQSLSYAQLPPNSSQPGAGTRRSFTLFGDLKVDESQASEPANVTFDVILYTRGNEVFARQRVGNGGRYRFNNVFNGDYYLAVELDSAEIARMPIMIPANAVEHIRQDLEFRWKGSAASAPGVVSAADNYNRSSQNRALYQRATQEIKNKNFTQAAATLRSVVEADPKDYPAWTDLGMVYFIEKKYDEAEKSYASAIAAKADHVPALVSLGRVRIAAKNNEGAVEALEAALKADPKSAMANYFLGEAYLALKKGSKAVGYLNEALRLDPVGMADAHLRLGSLYNLAGYKDRAALEYEQFLQKKPDYAERKRLEEYIQANKPKVAETPKP